MDENKYLKEKKKLKIEKKRRKQKSADRTLDKKRVNWIHVITIL